jgi:hypothetical protein
MPTITGLKRCRRTGIAKLQTLADLARQKIYHMREAAANLLPAAVVLEMRGLPPIIINMSILIWKQKICWNDFPALFRSQQRLRIARLWSMDSLVLYDQIPLASNVSTAGFSGRTPEVKAPRTSS